MMRCGVAGLFVVCAFSTPAAGADVAELVLPAMWQVKLDVEDAGIAGKWFAPDLNDKTWTPISTHKSVGWDQQGLPLHVGFAWYRTTMFVGMGFQKKHAYLYFSAVDEEAWVWVNGVSAGEHTCASEKLALPEIWKKPFFFDVTKLVRFERPNQFTVRVHNAAKMGGVYKPVFLFTGDAPMALADMQGRAEAAIEKLRTSRKPEIRYEVWAGYAYDPVTPDAVPEGDAPPPEGPSWGHSFVKEIQLNAACGELAPFAVHVRNRGAEELQMRMDLANVRHAERDFLVTADRVEARYVDYYLTRAGNVVPDPLPRTGGANCVYIPSGQTRSFFSLINTTGMPAGVWKGEVHVTPMRAGPILKLPFALDVAPVVLPGKMPIWVTMWEGNLNTRHADLDPRGGDEPYYDLLRRTGVNVVMFHYYYAIPWPVLDEAGVLTGINPVDFDRMLVRRRFGKDNFLLILIQATSSRRSEWWGKEFQSDQWNRNVVKYMRLLAAHIRTRHRIPDDRWALYLLDENIGEMFIALGKLVREADPTIRIWANRVEELDQVKKAEPYIDIYAPVRGHVGKFRESEAFLREKGKERWFYAHNGWFHDKTARSYHRHNPSSPHEIYRMDGWRAWDWNVRGMGYWVYGAYFQRYSGLGGEYRKASPGFIYAGQHGPVTTRRLEAYREGLEDYKLLWITNRAAGVPGQEEQAVRKARADIGASHKEVVAKRGHPDVLLKWRKTLLEDAATLCAAAPLDVAVAKVETTPTSASIVLEASKPVRVWAWLWHGTRYPSPGSRAWQFIASPEAGREPRVEIARLVPEEPCKVALVVGGPEGQQRVLDCQFRTKGWGTPLP